MSIMTHVSPIGTSASSSLKHLVVTNQVEDLELVSHLWTAGVDQASVVATRAMDNLATCWFTNVKSRNQSKWLAGFQTTQSLLRKEETSNWKKKLMMFLMPNALSLMINQTRFSIRFSIKMLNLVSNKKFINLNSLSSSSLFKRLLLPLTPMTQPSKTCVAKLLKLQTRLL